MQHHCCDEEYLWLDQVVQSPIETELIHFQWFQGHSLILGPVCHWSILENCHFYIQPESIFPPVCWLQQQSTCLVPSANLQVVPSIPLSMFLANVLNKAGFNLLLVSTWSSSHWPQLFVCDHPANSIFSRRICSMILPCGDETGHPVVPWVFLLPLFKNGGGSISGTSSESHDLSSRLATSSASSLRIWGCISSGQLPHLSFLDYPFQIFYSCQSQHMSITQSIPTIFCGSNQVIVPVWAVITSFFCLFPTDR